MKKIIEAIITEQPLIEWFKQLGYEYKFGPDISPGGVLCERDFKDVILENRLKNALKRLNPAVSEKIIEEAIYTLKRIGHPNLEIANKEIYRFLTEGIKVKIKGKEKRGDYKSF